MAYQPKSYKKFVATAATATLVASAVAPIASANVETAAFTDVAPQYKEAIDWLVKEGYTNGKTETTFGVYENILRGDAAKILAEASGLQDEDAPEAGFTDVPARGNLAIDSLKAAGVVNGKSATQFGFYDDITRGEMAIIIAKAFGLEGDADNNEFTDVSDRYADSVAALFDNGITNGKSATQFGTNDEISRGDFAIFVYRAAMAVAEPMVESLEFNAEGDMFTLEFNKLPEGADLAWVVENYDIEINGEAITDAQVDALNLSAEVDGTTITVSHTDLDDLRDALGGDSVELSVGGASDVYTFEPIMDPMVESVTVVNAKEIAVNFTQPVDEDTVIGTPGTDDTLEDGVFTINELSTNGVTANAVGSANGLAAELSEDGLTLTITADTFFDGRYEFTTAAELIETEDGTGLPSYTTIFTANDTVKPTIEGVTYTDFETAVVSFSEPVNSVGTPIFRYADGTTASVTVSPAFTSGSDSVTLDLSAADANKDITVTFVGVKDFNDNVISPNPASVTVKKDTTDNVAPTVTSITPTSATSFDIRLSEAVVDSTGTILVGSTDVSANATVNSTDRSLVNVTGVSSTVLDGLQTVTVNSDAFRDLTNNPSTAFSRVVNFSPDTVDPTVQSVSVQKVNNRNYLVVNFSENVNAVNGESFDVVSVNNVGETVTTTVTTNGTVDTLGYTTLYNPSNGQSSSIKIDINSLGAEDYSTDFAEGLVTDLYGNDSDAKQDVTFTVGTSTVKQSIDTDVSTNGITVVDADTLTVDFNDQLDIASATNASNYQVNGQAVKSAKILNNSAGTYRVELSLADGSVPLTGTYEVSVSGVSALNGSVMDAFNTTETLTENVRPTITKAELTSTSTVTVTFSEAVVNTTADTNDFELRIGGQTVSSNDVVTTQSQTTADNTLVLTLEAPVTSANLSSGLSLQLLNTVDIEDANGNVVSGPSSVTVVQ